MKFLLDENVDARLLPWLRGCRHDARRLVSDYPAGLPDGRVLAIAVAEGRILITNDRDFGTFVFAQRAAHTGVVLLRLGDYAELAVKIARLDDVLTHYAGALDRFLVVTERHVRAALNQPLRRKPARGRYCTSTA